VNILVDFAASGNSAAVRTYGWSNPEPTLVWTIGSESGVHLPAAEVPEPLILEVEVNPCLAPPIVTGQILRVRVNGQYVGGGRLSGKSRVRCHVKAGLLQAGQAIDVTFEHPGFVRNDFLSGSKDDRPLAISFFALRLYSERLAAENERAAPLPANATLIEMADRYDGEEPVAGGDRHLYTFQTHEPESAALIDGWYIDPEGSTWSAARVSQLELPAPGKGNGWYMCLALCPMRIGLLHPMQRVSVVLNGSVIGQFRVDAETTLSMALPDELVSLAGTLNLTFVCPDAIEMQRFATGLKEHTLGFILDSILLAPLLAPRLAPVGRALSAALPARSDELYAVRPMAVSAQFLEEPLDVLPEAIHRETGVTVSDMMKEFESLGDNCAFGLAQRKAGAEVLGLLRFANTPLKGLLAGMEEEFAAVANPSEAAINLHDDGEPPEYMLRVDRYGIRWHTAVHEPDASADVVFKQQTVRLRYLRRKFGEGLRAGRKVYTVARATPRTLEVVDPCWGSSPTYEVMPGPLLFAEALSIFIALGRFADNTLLYLVPSTGSQRSGTVEMLAPGLMRGYLPTFVISEDVKVADHADWLRVVANAWLLLAASRVSQDSREVTKIA
jgi:hypothetical protein